LPQNYTIVFAAAGAANGSDSVVDFVHGTDQLLFTGADYGFAAGHTLTSNEFTVGAAAVDDTPQFIWNPTTHVLYWDSDGNGSHAAVIIAGFQNRGVVTASDIHFT